MSQIDLILENFARRNGRAEHSFNRQSGKSAKISELSVRGHAVSVCYPTLGQIEDEEVKRRLMTISNSGLYLRNQTHFQASSGAVLSFVGGQLHLVILNIEQMEFAEFILKFLRFDDEIKRIIASLEAEVDQAKIHVGFERFDSSNGLSPHVA